MTHTVTVLGATGYTGRELVRILAGHADLLVERATTTSRAGVALADVHPELRGLTDVVLEGYDAATAAASDAVVSCLPHKESMTVLAALARDYDVKLVDLSGDFRFPDAATYEAAYGTAHADPELTARAAYGLPELFRDTIADAPLVANPGCYPTGALLGLAPLAAQGILEDVIVDAKSGLTGAGASPGAATHFAKANESVTPYKLFTHRHAPEIATHLGRIAGGSVPVTFTPHLVPMDRGILSTIYADLSDELDEEDARKMYADFYADEPFVRLLPEGATADTKYVTNTNFADVGLAVAPDGKRLIISTAIDNLVKGASGQAVQNLNLLFALDETAGLLPARKKESTQVHA